VTARALARPILVHVVTRRGTGYRPAEQHPDVYDAVGPFDAATGRPAAQTSRPTYAEAFQEALVEAADRDPSVVVVAARGGRGGLKLFAKRHPKRFHDAQAATQHAVAFAAGLARQGLKPVVTVPLEALRRGFDQVLHEVCRNNLPVTFAVEGAGLGDESEPAPSGSFDLSLLRLAPNLVIMAPKDPAELASMLEAAVEMEGPAALVYPRGTGVGVERDGPIHPIEVGRAEPVRSGRHVALWACGPAVSPALEAAELLAGEGIEASVVNARFVKPIDNALLCEQARQVGVLVTVEENALAGGFGSAVLEVLEMARLPATAVHRIGLPESILEPGSSGALRRTVGLDAEGISAGVRRALDDRPPISLRHARGSTR
jgi:1-deoxy-D-xylulose-5-phosphate synthase